MQHRERRQPRSDSASSKPRPPCAGSTSRACPGQRSTSLSPRADRLSAMPERADTPASGRTVASIGSHGSTSIPRSHAAVRPEKAALGGSLRAAACSRCNGVSRTWLATHVSGPRRLKEAASRCHRSSPACLASASVNGPLVSCGGTSGLRGIAESMPWSERPYNAAC